jgi:two-component system, sensor histidine kinase PdtaS
VALLHPPAVDRADFTPDDIAALGRLVGEWDLVADLALSDLVLWVPTWNDAGFIAAAHVRPTTAATVISDDIVGTFKARGRTLYIEQALSHGQPVTRRGSDRPWQPIGPEAFPVKAAGRVIGVVERLPSAVIRAAGRLEEVYLQTADQLLTQLVAGAYPPVDVIQNATGTARVGDGMLQLDEAGGITYASPNAVSALHRLGSTIDPVGTSLRTIITHLTQRFGPVDESIAQLASGKVAGRADVEHNDVTVLVRSVPLSGGAMVLMRDVTETRRRDRALVTKDATIREIHHRVKNNLQTVAALLRLQGRRVVGEEAKAALAEAQVRIAAIAVVHDLLASGGAGRVPFAEVTDRIIALVRELAPAYGAGDVTIVREGECGSLTPEITTPLAMATTELLQNAIEHAQATRIEVLLTQLDGTVRIDVRDDGRGVPMPPPTDGLGLQIVESLIRGDLRGTFHIAAETLGTRATIEVTTDTRT